MSCCILPPNGTIASIGVTLVRIPVVPPGGRWRQPGVDEAEEPIDQRPFSRRPGRSEPIAGGAGHCQQAKPLQVIALLMQPPVRL
jgi:hypothetical protein